MSKSFAPSRKENADMVNQENYQLVFREEFDEAELDETKWLSQYFPHAAPDLERCKPRYFIQDSILHLYIDQTTPTYADDSDMKVSSIQTIERNGLHPGAGTVNLHEVEPYEGFAIQYGYFEMRAKLPQCGGGGHMAWWLIGTQEDVGADGLGSLQTGEIDIVETLFAQNHLFRPSIHKWTDSNLQEFHQECFLEDFDSEAYHIYGLDWSPNGLKFYLDGQCLVQTDQSPAYRMGMFLGLYTNCDWSGEDNGVYPKTLCVDYIRVYQHQ